MEILKFYSPTCGPCKVLERKLDEEKINYTNVDVTLSESADNISKYRVTTIPTLVIVKDSQEIKRYHGIINNEQLKEIKELCNI